MSAGLVVILNQARITGGANQQSIPVLVGRWKGDGSERVAPGRPVILEVDRNRDGTSGALEGTFSLWGVNLPHPYGFNANVNVFQGRDGASGKTVFDTAIAHQAFSNHNWIVIQNGVVLAQGAGAGKFQISNNGGLARVTLGTAAGDGDVIEVYFCAPAQLLAVGANENVRTSIIARQLMWADIVVAATNFSGTVVTIQPEAN